MTSPRSRIHPTSENRLESLTDWFQLHDKKVVWTSIALIVVIAAGWFYNRSQELKAERAERAYFAAQRSVMAGNQPLAESDLKKMIGRYEGTSGAMQARLVLAQVLYDQGKFQDGLNQLLEAEDKMGGTEEFGPSVHLMLAGGYEQLKKFAEAAVQYGKAAKAARFDQDRQRYESFAARAYLTVGDTAKAKALWTVLGEDSKGTMAGEARVRMGELMAQPAPKS